MTAAEIAARLGGGARSGPWWRCPYPVYASRTGRSATLALRDGERGLIVKCFDEPAPGPGRAESHERRLESEAAQPPVGETDREVALPSRRPRSGPAGAGKSARLCEMARGRSGHSPPLNSTKFNPKTRQVHGRGRRV